MSTIDASIPLGVKPFQMESPVNQLAQLMQVRHLQQQGELGQLTMEEKRRSISETNALNSLYQTALKPDGTIDRNALFTGAAQQGLGSKIPALRKGFLEEDEAKGKVDKQKVELIDAKLKQSRAYLENVTTPEQYIAWHEANHRDPILGPELAARGVTADQARARIQQALQTPGGFQQLLQQSALGLEKFTELNKPHYQKMDSGQVEQLIAVPGLGGAPSVVSSVQKVETPDALLSSRTSTENNKRSVGASMANAAATREVAQATRDAANIQTGFKNEQDLRKEFEGLPEIKNYKQAYPAYAAIKDAASRNTTQSDINIVYGLAKLYDPTSVVREGEYATVANSPNIPERVKGYAQYLQGGGKLSPETKRQILAEAQGRIGTYEAEARKAKGSYEQIAKTRGMNPSGVFADMGDMTGGTQTATPGIPSANDIDAELRRRQGKK